MLQLLLLEELSRQSNQLVQKKGVYISPQKWEELAIEAQLPFSHISKVIDGWCTNSENGTSFPAKRWQPIHPIPGTLRYHSISRRAGKTTRDREQKGKASAKKATQKKLKLFK